MSNVAQTWTIIGAFVALLGIVVGLQTFWISRSLDKLEHALGAVGDEVHETRDVLLRDHGERIARLEERIDH